MSDPPPTLLDVPDDALLLIATHDLPSALSFRSTCESLHVRLLEVGKKIADQRKADAGRSRAEMSLVAMSNKSEIDRAAERAIARMKAAGVVVGPAASSAGAAKSANLASQRAAAAFVAAAHQPAPLLPSEVVPPPQPHAATVAAAAAAGAAAAPTRRRSSFTGLMSKLTVKDVR
tara:strand:- start:292 stop:816 length:525 start_codon:yes stop_codon:yes gene_type:complete